MATRPTDPGPVTGRIDASGRLVAADPALEALQRDAGSSLGAPVAIPQLAAIVRIARQLKIPVSRRAVAAGADQDVDMWVRAVPEGEEVALTIERWSARPPTRPRLASLSDVEPDAAAGPCRWAVDDQLRLVVISEAAAELIGVSVAEAAGQPLTKLVRLEGNGDGEMPMLQALASRSGFTGQPGRRRSDDSSLLLSGEVVLGPDDGFAGFEGSIALADKPAAAEPVTSDPAFNEVLRLPLRRIIESADHIVGRSDGPLRDEYAVYASDISAAAHHLLSVVRSMGQDPASGRATIDLVELVYEAVGLIESAATEREIAIAVEPLQTFTAQGESRGVIQILVNLIGNAVRHSSEQATVTISFEASGRYSTVHVADDGPGIDPADQQRIFERFEQGTTHGPGSGLGLAIARRLARAMGGDIQLESRPGMGSRFSLVLPAA
ncbi:MAG: HAMP domain-containing histidine kinase [Sphingomonas sp.]|nr:HAMP domain-containing histidine kinase [Sphingomonas sp.]